MLPAFVGCVLFSFLFELGRLLIAWYLSQPPKSLREKEDKLVDAKAEVSAIKSVQLELVKHSLATRKVIKIEKEIEAIKESFIPASKNMKNSFRIVRLVVYALAAFVLFPNTSFFLDIKMLWPVSFFFGWSSSTTAASSLVEVHSLIFLFFCGLACRHVLRTIASLVAPNSNIA